MKSSKDKGQRKKGAVLWTRFAQSESASGSHVALSWVLGSRQGKDLPNNGFLTGGGQGS